MIDAGKLRNLIQWALPLSSKDDSTALVLAADCVSAEIAKTLVGGAAAKHPKKTPKKHLATAMAA